VTNLIPGSSPPKSKWHHARHVDLIDEHLVKLHAREYLKAGYLGLIIETPPRHGKSELVSHYDSVYYLGAHPDDRIILTSYEANFAAHWGRKVRDTMDEWGEMLYGISVSGTSSAADRWDLKGHQGGMYTAGARGAITGRGANYLKMDDPIKNMEEAQSETIRQRIWDNWVSALRTRIEPGGVAVVIGTRWHEDDLIGRLLRAEVEDPDADKWIRIRLPALAEEPDEDFPEEDQLGREPGEALWPERWPEWRLKPHQANAYNWGSLYQQRPAPLEGGLFQQDWLPVVPDPRTGFKKNIRYWDMAATDPKKGEDPDWTVGLLLGEHKDGLYYVRDVNRFRADPGKVERIMRGVAKEDGHLVRIRVEREPGSQGKLYIRHLARSHFNGYAFRGVRATGPKEVRADAVSGACERGEIRLVRGVWNRDFIREVTKYPNATKDDQVDAFSGAFQEMTKTGRVWSA
jgi:predicted phage terminase large subunit-like protein